VAGLSALTLLRGVAERLKRGGVMYCEPGVAGAEERGRPSNARCEGVRGISPISSFAVARGRTALRTLIKRTRRMALRAYWGYG